MQKAYINVDFFKEILYFEKWKKAIEKGPGLSVIYGCELLVNEGLLLYKF